MRTRLLAGLALTLAVTVPGTVLAQDPTPNPGLALPRAVAAAYAAGTRSPDGNPGPSYWQNDAVHDIQLTVNPPDRTVHATQTITYRNNSPRDLAAIPLRLYLNAHRPNAVREQVYPPEFLTDGIVIDSLTMDGVDVPLTPDANIKTLTVAVLPLPTPIKAGAEATFEIAWHFDLAQYAAKEGVIDPTTFYLAYFFPRIAPIRDDEWGDIDGKYPGFDVQEFTYRSGRELNNDFADFTVSLTVPKDYIVWGTGELQNPDEVLQADAAKKYADSLTSDETINLATPADLAAGKVTAQTDTVTWRFKAEDVMDVAFGLSDHYIWDAASVVGDPATGARVGVQGAYPESAVKNYAGIAQDQRAVITYASTQWPGVAWPYPRSTVFVGGADEEYPMMANDSAEAPIAGIPVRFVAAHEMYHQYFPFLMGTNEQRYPILDEGWTTAFEYLFNAQDLPPGVEDQIFTLVRAATITPPWSGSEIEAIHPADSLRGSAAAENGYAKASMAYLSLKYLLGDDAFQAGLQGFIERWQGKHPLPWDMFNTFSDVTGQDLTWFWQNWFYSDHFIDLALGPVQQADGGWTVEVRNPGGFAIPFAVVATYADGTTQVQSGGVDRWKDATTTTITLDGTNEPMKVQIGTGPFGDSTPADATWISPNAPVPSPSPAAPAASGAPAASPAA